MKQRYDYDIVVESPLGERRGTLTVEETGSAISGSLSLLGFENHVAGKREGHMLYLHHRLRTLFNQLTCLSELRLQGDSLFGTIRSEFGSMKVRGEKTAGMEHTTA